MRRRRKLLEHFAAGRPPGIRGRREQWHLGPGTYGQLSKLTGEGDGAQVIGPRFHETAVQAWASNAHEAWSLANVVDPRTYRRGLRRRWRDDGDGQPPSSRSRARPAATRFGCSPAHRDSGPGSDAEWQASRGVGDGGRH